MADKPKTWQPTEKTPEQLEAIRKQKENEERKKENSRQHKEMVSKQEQEQKKDQKSNLVTDVLSQQVNDALIAEINDVENQDQFRIKLLSNTKGHTLISHLKPFQEFTSQAVKDYTASWEDVFTIHPTLIELGLKFNQNLILGSNERCIAFLQAILEIINDFSILEPKAFKKTFDKFLDQVVSFIGNFRSVNEGMHTAHQFCKLLMTHPQFPETESLHNQKQWLSSQIRRFIEDKIILADKRIIEYGISMIQDGDLICTYARSEVVERLLIEAHQKGKNFTVLVIDSISFGEGQKLLQALTNEGIECIYSILSHAAYFMRKITQIFVGASSMLTNGALISRVGTALLACIAHDYRIPFQIFCETYKFSEKTQLDSLSRNELCKPFTSQSSQESQSNQFIEINLCYDSTPIENISMVITEIGAVPPSSVRAILRGDFSINNYAERIGDLKLISENVEL